MTTTAPAPLTSRQREILAYIAGFIAEHGFSPSTRDICVAFGFRGPNGALCHLRPLRSKGLITWVPMSPRTIRLTEAGEHELRNT